MQGFGSSVLHAFGHVKASGGFGFGVWGSRIRGKGVRALYGLGRMLVLDSSLA